MATPLFYLDESLKSVTIVSQSPERTVHIVNELIKDKVLNPGEYDRVFFECPCSVAPLTISTSKNKRYKTIYIISGYVGNQTYVSFKEPYGTDVVYNADYVYQILNLLGITITEEMKKILKDSSKLCDKNGFYKAKLVKGEGLSYRENFGTNVIKIDY